MQSQNNVNSQDNMNSQAYLDQLDDSELLAIMDTTEGLDR